MVGLYKSTIMAFGRCLSGKTPVKQNLFGGLAIVSIIWIKLSSWGDTVRN
jgi:hypothetical protein